MEWLNTIVPALSTKAHPGMVFRDFSRAIELVNKPLLAAYTGRATAYGRAGRIAEAKADLGKVIELVTAMMLTPEYNKCAGGIRLQRGFAYAALERYREAAQDFDEVIKESPESHQGYYYRAMLFGVQKQYQRALADLNKSIALCPDYALAYKERAEIYDKLNEKEKARLDRAKFEELSTVK